MQNIKSKISNFIYYYKWYILIILFFVVVIGIMAHQMVSQEKYDMRIMYAGPKIFTEAEKAAVPDALVQLGEDYDGNGEKNAQLFDLIIMNDQELAEAYEAGYNPYYLNGTTVNENRETMTFHAMANEFTLLFLSPENYDLLKKHNILVALKDLGYEELPYAAIDEYAIRLKDLDASVFFAGFACLPDDTVVCIKRISESKDGKSKADKHQANHIELFKRIVGFELPDDFVIQSQDGEKSDDQSDSAA